MRLKDLRVALGMSQKELADKLGYKQNTVSQWESEKRLMDVEVLTKSAKFFNCSTDYIIGLSDVKNEKAKSTKGEQFIINQYNLLNDLGKREAIKRVNELTHIQAYSLREMPIAAHTDAPITDEELRLMREDIEDL